MNDLISRQEALNALDEEFPVWTDSFDYSLGERNQWHTDTRIIENLPSAQPERKIAYLINPNPYGECSECGQLIDKRDGFNFCPNCGATMEDGDNG